MAQATHVGDPSEVSAPIFSVIQPQQLHSGIEATNTNSPLPLFISYCMGVCIRGAHTLIAMNS